MTAILKHLSMKYPLADWQAVKNSQSINHIYPQKTNIRTGFSSFLNWQFISAVRFEDVEGINRRRSFAPYQNKKFQGFIDQWKTYCNKCVECQGGRFWRKLTFHSLFFFISW